MVGSGFSGTAAGDGSAVPVLARVAVDEHGVGSRFAGFLRGACIVNERLGAFAGYMMRYCDLVFRVLEGLGENGSRGWGFVG